MYIAGPPAFLFGAPRWVVRQLIQQGLRVALATITWRRERRLAAMWMLGVNWGRLIEGWRMRKRGQG